MYINAVDQSNFHEMVLVEDKFIPFDLPLQTCRRSRDRDSLVLNFPSINEFFKDDAPYFRLSLVRLVLDIPEGLLYVYYRRRTFGEEFVNPYAYHHVRCSNEELETIIHKIYREDCKDPFFVKTTLHECLEFNRTHPDWIC